jgi:hydroxymethylglutaryl-CoA reductase
MTKHVFGFSKFNKAQKIEWISQSFLADVPDAHSILQQYWNDDDKLQELHDGFSENTISNFYLPYGIAPNFLIDGETYAIPMAVEESSVVAAASKAAKFWQDRGGFKTRIIGTEKVGQVHLMYHGLNSEMEAFYAFAKAELLQSIESLNASMKKRGGGIKELRLVNKTTDLDGYYQLHATFETRDAMGANFINSTLEQLAASLKAQSEIYEGFSADAPEVVMSILSNYVPNCRVHVQVDCPVQDLGVVNGVPAETFASKFARAVEIAIIEPYRAVTHNKGIMNGIDAVVIATGNDFRAVEAAVHAYAARDGKYRSLTKARVEDNHFYFEAEFPLALGTIGGLTSLHPLAKLSLQILQNPSAEDLMRIVAVCGLAQNFAAIHSLVTTGIQKGHMKMHLNNMLDQIGASDEEANKVKEKLGDETPNYSRLKEILADIRD